MITVQFSDLRAGDAVIMGGSGVCVILSTRQDAGGSATLIVTFMSVQSVFSAWKARRDTVVILCDTRGHSE